MAKLSTKQKIEKYLTIDEHQIMAKTDLIIRIDSDELKIEDEELVDVSDDVSDVLVGSIKIPGILNIEVDNDTVQLYFPFDINFVIPDVYTKDKNITTYEFKENDMICFASTKSNATDIMILDKLFENRVKYLRGDLAKHIIAIYDQLLSTSNISMQHIETILTVMYGEYNAEGFVPVRLNSQKYTKANAISTKASAHRFNAGNGFSYGYTRDVISDNITRTYEPELTDLEKVISGKYDELGK